MWRTLTTTGGSEQATPPHGNTPDEQAEPVPDGRIPLWRAHNGLRVLALIYAFTWFCVLLPEYRSPVGASVIMAAMVCWTTYTIWRYSKPSGRTRTLVLVDQAVTMTLFGLCYFVLTEHQMDQGLPTVVTIWHASMVTVAAVRFGIPGGFASGAVAAAANFAMRGYIDANMWMDTVLHLAIGLLLGLASETAEHSTRRLARALRTEAATAERERLARDIHDSVLQVLARVRRRGGELGGEAAELAALAGEQETALRNLISTGPAERGETSTDLAARLRVLAGTRVNVSVPATEVTLPAETVSALFSVTREAVQNVEDHTGPETHTWVLLEDLGSEIVLSIRDNGPGIPDGRLEEAAAAGRMGVAQSIRGRVESLGGSIALDTSVGEGTEWEIRLTRADGRENDHAHSGERAREKH
ncbi:MacS family sensor histidine kinase [Actinopolyspora xinjiangensis]|nr:DUF5931 domain-containing protein [Actinopolyspora xinjiangensis]